jgi:hypothetical protein
MTHTTRRLRLRASVAAAFAVTAALGFGAGPALAGDRTVDPNTLTPAPPDFFDATCAWTGGQVQCDLAFVDPVSPFEEPTGILCGSGGSQFEVLDTWSREVTGKRIYNGDGLLVRRHFRDTWAGTFTNSATGATVAYEQRNTYLHNLAVPGNPGSGEEQQTTHLRLMTRVGSVVLESGRVVINHDEDAVVSASGIHAFAAYFDDGDADALQPICAALS